jgi:LacI family transcriptional regulator
MLLGESASGEAGLGLDFAGDVDSELGFLEGAKNSSRAEVKAEVAYHRDDAVSVGRALNRLLDQPAPPTGIVVCNSYAYLSAISWLAQRGLCVPRDLSLISRDDDPFLNALAPAPARYVAAPRQFATRLLGPLLGWVNGRNGAGKPARLIPRYVAGGSTAAV